jgi:hypothetical protein
MLAKILSTGLYAFLIFWALQAAYVLWWAYRNNALPSFPRSRGFAIKWKILEGRAHRERA